MLIYVLRHPLAQRRVLRRGAPVAYAVVLLRFGEELTGHDVPDRVVAEGPDLARRPVHVLQHPESVVRHIEPEVFLHLRVPGFRQIGDGEGAVDQ